MKISEGNNLSKFNFLYQKALVIVFLCFMLHPFVISGQSQNTNLYILSLIDSVQKTYGSNDLLINGKVYYQPNRMASGTPFLFSPIFEPGTIFTRGLSFEVAGLNYNIVDHELILLNITSDGAKLHIKLSNILIDSFLLNDYLFVNLEELNIPSDYPHMLVTNKGSCYFLIGYDKEFVNRYSENNPYGKFSSTKKLLFLVCDGTLVRINSKKAFLESFPSIKKETSTFLKNHNTKLSKASPEQLKQLMEFCNNQMAKSYE